MNVPIKLLWYVRDLNLICNSSELFPLNRVFSSARIQRVSNSQHHGRPFSHGILQDIARASPEIAIRLRINTRRTVCPGIRRDLSLPAGNRSRNFLHHSRVGEGRRRRSKFAGEQVSRARAPEPGVADRQSTGIGT